MCDSTMQVQESFAVVAMVTMIYEAQPFNAIKRLTFIHYTLATYS